MAAAAAGCDACVRILLEGGADVKARNGAGLTVLHNAAFEGNPATVKQLLEAGAPVNVAGRSGFTPLMMAVSSRTKNPTCRAYCWTMALILRRKTVWGVPCSIGLASERVRRS
jgi:ankyrin repeat protein